MDQDDAFGWLWLCFLSLLGAAVVIGLGLLIAWQWRESSAKQACRTSGSQVILDKDGEWHCAKPAMERTGG